LGGKKQGISCKNRHIPPITRGLPTSNEAAGHVHAGTEIRRLAIGRAQILSKHIIFVRFDAQRRDKEKNFV
jgi:hypothetical protein